jgi:Phosphatidylserine synthase
LLAGMVWVLHSDYQFEGAQVDGLAWLITLFAGLSMVSNIRFYSFKDLNLRRSVPFWAALLILLLFVVLSLDQSRVLWGFFLIYGISGYVMWVVRFWQRRGQPRPVGATVVEPADDTSEPEH